METVFLWTALMACAAILLLRPLAPRVGLVDKPDGRKAHLGSIPLVGGLALFAGMAPVLLFLGPFSNGHALLAGATLLLVTGAVDDIRRVGAMARLLIQGAAIFLLAVVGSTVIESLGNIGLGGSRLELGHLAAAFTIFAGLGVVNAVNMSDGLDGLSASLAMVTLAALGVVAAVAGRSEELFLISALAGGLAGFLVFNLRLPGRSQALVFLGDAGSYLLGFFLFYLLVRLSQGDDPAMSPVTALWLCLVPLFDTVGMMLRRIRRKRSPFIADREHIHHVFLLAGFTVNETVAVMTGTAVLAAGFGLAAYYLGVPDAVMFILFLALAAGYYRMILRAWTVMRFLSRSICRRDNRRDRRSGGDRRKAPDAVVVAMVGCDRRAGEDRRRHPDRRCTPPARLPGAGPEPSLARRERIDEEPGRAAPRTT